MVGDVLGRIDREVSGCIAVPGYRVFDVGAFADVTYNESDDIFTGVICVKYEIGC